MRCLVRPSSWLCPHMREEVVASLIRARISRPNHLREATPPNTIMLGVRISNCAFWGDTNKIGGATLQGALKTMLRSLEFISKALESH